MQPSAVEVSIMGCPVLSGRLLQPADPELQTLRTLNEWTAFARKLRGQFCITIHDADGVTAITDFCGSYPIYYLACQEGYRVSTRLSDLRPYCSGQISREALYFFGARGSIGIDPLYAGVRQVFPATVIRLAREVQERRYVDWTEMGSERDVDCDRALRTFVDCASSFLAAVTRNEPHVGCLLSGGTDSAIVAWLLKRVHPRVTCFTHDYRIGRYSEYTAALDHAERLGAAHQRVMVGRRDHWSAFEAMNSSEADLPASHSHLTSLHKTANAARELGIRMLFTGDNADTLFMGLEGFFSGLPDELDAYARHARELSTEQKLGRAICWSQMGERGAAVFRAMGIDPAECEQWIKQRGRMDRNTFEPFASRFALWRFLQITGQFWAGVPYQSCWLPAERSAGVVFVSPFLDVEMVRFGISLPIELKFRNGIKKYLLHHLLERETSLRIEKRSSPNPSRLWTLFPDASLPFKMDTRLRGPYAGFCVRNIAKRGALHTSVANIAALGLWLRQHKLGDVASRKPCYAPDGSPPEVVFKTRADAARIIK